MTRLPVTPQRIKALLRADKRRSAEMTGPLLTLLDSPNWRPTRRPDGGAARRIYTLALRHGRGRPMRSRSATGIAG